MEALGRYRVLRRIRTGSGAEVFEALAEGPGGFTRKVAIKRLLVPTPVEVEQAFLDEARIAGQLHHGAILGVYDVVKSGADLFQVLEWVSGLDLADLRDHAVQNGVAVSEEVALVVASEVASALDFAHHASDERGKPLNIVHRDVSPTNVLVSWIGEVKLADFGVALFSSLNREMTEAGISKGKPAFMAPEQMFGGDVDRRADIFSLGCVLSWFLTGESPLDSAEARRSFFAGGALPRASILSAETMQIVDRATRRVPEERYATAAEMAHAAAELVIRRTRQDPRFVIRCWLDRLRPAASSPAKKPTFGAAAMFSVDLLEGQSEEVDFEAPPEGTLGQLTAVTALQNVPSAAELRGALERLHRKPTAAADFDQTFIDGEVDPDSTIGSEGPPSAPSSPARGKGPQKRGG